MGEVTFSRVEVSTPKVSGAVRRALRRMNKSASRLTIVRSVQHITQKMIGSICNIYIFFLNIFIYTENFFRQIACSPFCSSLHVLGDLV